MPATKIIIIIIIIIILIIILEVLLLPNYNSNNNIINNSNRLDTDNSNNNNNDNNSGKRNTNISNARSCCNCVVHCGNWMNNCSRIVANGIAINMINDDIINTIIRAAVAVPAVVTVSPGAL